MDDPEAISPNGDQQQHLPLIVGNDAQEVTDSNFKGSNGKKKASVGGSIEGIVANTLCVLV